MATVDWRQRLQDVLSDFGQRQRDVKAKHAANGTKYDRVAAARAFHSELVDNHLAAPGWPRSVGGLELSLEDQLEYYRLTTAAGAPPHPCPLSFIVAPVIIKYGTPEQRSRFLEPLLRADEFWCQGFSEPGAGSDLASLATRAERVDETYRVSGQKVWTTMADQADWMFTLVRTGPAKRGSEGITYLLIPMNSPGITVRPLRDISGSNHFAEVFFDDVEVPVQNVLGQEGEGWSIMRTSLGHERATAFLADEFKYRRTADQVIDQLIRSGLDDDPLVRQDIARVEAGVRAIAANSARALKAVLRGEDPGAVASVNRLVKSEFEQHLHTVALRAAGPSALLGSRAPDAYDGGRWTYGYLKTRASTIGAGTAEIQRNTIAETVLGLPSHRGEGRRVPVVAPGSPLIDSDENEHELREVLGKALDSRVDLTQRLQNATSNDAQAAWSTLVEFGLPGLAADEAVGGGGAARALLYAAIEQAGAKLAAGDLVPSVVALEVAAATGAESITRRITAGERACFAVPLADAGWVMSGPALPVWSGSALNGSVPLVVGGASAAILLVLAAGAEGEVLVAVEADAAGVAVAPQESLDLGSTVAKISFDHAVGEMICDGEQLGAALDVAWCKALLATAADSVGVGAQALADAVQWAGEREQFGRKIGSFQAISHTCADVLVAVEGARGQVVAAGSAGAPDEIDCLLAAAAAFDAAVFASERNIQTHGGIGFTWEHPAHLFLRRAQANAVCIGRAEALRDRAARLAVARRRAVATTDRDT
jgi:acyl-CoA dehydrogenase